MKRSSLLIIFLVLVFILVSFAFCFADDTEVSETPVEGDFIVKQDSKAQVLRVSANDTNGLHSIILSLIGDYNPIVKDYTYTSNSGYTSHAVEITPDYSWILTCALFIVIVFCVFRFIGGIFSK